MSHEGWRYGRFDTNYVVGASLLNYGRVDLDTHYRDAETKMLLPDAGQNIIIPENVDYRPRRLTVQSTQTVTLAPGVKPWGTRDSIIIAKLKGTDVLYNTRILTDGNLASCEGGIRIFQSDPNSNTPLINHHPKTFTSDLLVYEKSDAGLYGRFKVTGRASKQNWRIGDWLEITNAPNASVNGIWQISLEEQDGTVITDERAWRTDRNIIDKLVLTDVDGVKCPIFATSGTVLWTNVGIRKITEGCPLIEIARLTGTSGVPITTPNPVTQYYDQGPFLGWFHEGKSIYELVQIAYTQYLTNNSISAIDDIYTQKLFGNCWQKPPQENDDYYVCFNFDANPTLDAGIQSRISFSIEYITD